LALRLLVEAPCKRSEIKKQYKLFGPLIIAPENWCDF